MLPETPPQRSDCSGAPCSFVSDVRFVPHSLPKWLSHVVSSAGGHYADAALDRHRQGIYCMPFVCLVCAFSVRTSSLALLGGLQVLERLLDDVANPCGTVVVAALLRRGVDAREEVGIKAQVNSLHLLALGFRFRLPLTGNIRGAGEKGLLSSLPLLFVHHLRGRG